jgi:PEP-CTERM motif-containing protein
MKIRDIKWHMILAILGLLWLCGANPLKAGSLATADLTPTKIGPSLYQYSVTLHDTGTTNIGTFWFGWVPGQNFMSSSPTSILSPTSWMDAVTHGGPGDGYAIQWVASNPGAALTPGNSLSGFVFDSTMTPSQMAGFSTDHPAYPVGTSFVYIGPPFGDPGYQFVATVNEVSTTPEPSSLLLFGTSLLGLLPFGRKLLGK